ncbi:MAG: serine hydrolase [Hyphomicrobiales bacterium]
MGHPTPPTVHQVWPSAQPASLGLSPDIDRLLEAAVAQGEFPGLHALLLLRHGRLALERYFPGRDALWGRDLGLVEHGPDRLHDLRSVTKSIVGLLYGVALAAGLVPPPRTRLLALYPQRDDGDPRRRRITIGHVLSMRMGIAWSEGTDYDNPANSEIAMEAAPDRIGYVLSRPMVEPPGTRWAYCGGATALLGDLIARGSGQDLEAFARDRLFAPMGITDLEWVRGHDGVPVSSSGLRMRPRDLARLGQMVLDGGRMDSLRLVPSNWLAQSFQPRGQIESGLRYGYQWWIGSLAASGKRWAAAYGNGGQRLIVIPSLGLVVVILAGNYNAPDQWRMPLKLMSRIVIPAIRSQTR